MLDSEDSEDNEQQRLRDYFAGQALVGILAQRGYRVDPLQDPTDPAQEIAAEAYHLAEEMLLARDGL